MLPELEDLDGWLAHREAAVGGVRAGCAKQVLWADGPAQTDLAIVYIHGFSATGAEVRPLPDMLGQALGANVYFARLSGHGQSGAAMGQARLPDWERDVDEALAIGAALGREVIVMGCSTGCTLVTTALARGAVAKGVVYISPNFGLRHVLAHGLLQMPAVRSWGPWVAGKTRRFDQISDAHAALWTLEYDIQAVFTMADAVRAAMGSAIETINTPAYFAFCETDQVVNPAKTRTVISRWSGKVAQDILVQGPDDDKMGHVMAGDVLSTHETDGLAVRLTDWAKAL